MSILGDTSFSKTHIKIPTPENAGFERRLKMLKSWPGKKIKTSLVQQISGAANCCVS